MTWQYGTVIGAPGGGVYVVISADERANRDEGTDNYWVLPIAGDDEDKGLMRATTGEDDGYWTVVWQPPDERDTATVIRDVLAQYGAGK